MQAIDVTLQTVGSSTHSLLVQSQTEILPPTFLLLITVIYCSRLLFYYRADKRILQLNVSHFL